ncbi:uncharacterized protein LOC129768149 isoform X2 [Toxorhynchites rutilus septentrionalis]|uniref:uncharacterized protein LOC129768149 isoform X2 n=1 Tax=Toxorhynchites rutilus septentrionalis TaxID=329112 RepID=UPI00247AB8D4|nr:uncharacterized protein LOC129768149 isoform X2 [Toxorhynchites rutilus septentrionalis]
MYPLYAGYGHTLPSQVDSLTSFYYRSDQLVIDILLTVIRKLENSIITVKICPNYFIMLHDLRQILGLVPNLENLYIVSRICPELGGREIMEPFPVLRRLKHLYLENDGGLQLDEIDFRDLTPNIVSLDMDCDSERALAVYKHFSLQLREIAVFFKRDDFFLPFCDLRFAELEVLDFHSDDQQFDVPYAVQTICNFFRRMPKLQKLTLRCKVNEQVLAAITTSCPELTTLYLKGDNLEDTSFRHLSHLKKLNSLRIEGWIRCDILHTCNPLPSLHNIYLHSMLIDDTQGFFGLLKDFAPNLRTLEAIESDIDDECLKHISCNITTLQTLVLDFCPNITDEAFCFLDRLEQLRVLKLGYLDIPQTLFEIIPENSIRHFSLYRCDKIDDTALPMVAEKFPKLCYLEIASCHKITLEGVEKIRELMPNTNVESFLLF